MTGETHGAVKSRFTAALSAWALLFLASPGVLSRDGSALLALCGLVPWAHVCSRPGRKAFLLEWLAAAIGLSASCFWSTYVTWITLLAVAIVPAFYMAVAGAVLRRLSPRFPLSIAAPAAWVGLETLRYVIEPPFGFSWMRLGHHVHALPILAGSARVWGVGGLSWTVAALAGGIADLWRRRDSNAGKSATEDRASTSPAGQAARSWFALAPALGPLALSIALSLATSAPKTQDGPRLMMVQSAFEQHRKMEAQDPDELFEDSVRLTAAGIAEARRLSEPEPDLVCWGETVLPYSISETGLAQAFDHGARCRPWGRFQLDRRQIEITFQNEEHCLRGVLMGQRTGGLGRILPRGASFLSGAEYFALNGNDIRRQNAIVVWNAAGDRIGVGGKIHLVPGAEELYGLERLAWVSDLAFSLGVGGYVPDLLAFDRTKVVELKARDGRVSRLGLSVCFDNAFDDPYTQPLREGELDFHLVCSNEAWYETSFEYDQMVAFSRLCAIMTGRSFVRATNAGITIALDPDGREIARLSRDGQDRLIPGTLRVTIPIPVDGERPAPRPPYVGLERGWLALWCLMPLGLLLLARTRPVTGLH